MEFLPVAGRSFTQDSKSFDLFSAMDQSSGNVVYADSGFNLNPENALGLKRYRRKRKRM